MRPTDDLVTQLLGIAEGVAAFGDHADNLAGEHLAQAAREAIDEYWEQIGDYPSAARRHRDQIFGLLLNTTPHRVLN